MMWANAIRNLSNPMFVSYQLLSRPPDEPFEEGHEAHDVQLGKMGNVLFSVI